MSNVSTLVILIVPASFVNNPSPSATAVVPLLVPPSIKFTSSTVVDICVVDAVANGCKVPAAFAMLTLLSAVGSMTPNVVSNASAVEQLQAFLPKPKKKKSKGGGF